jgi:hypothetical protein
MFTIFVDDFCCLHLYPTSYHGLPHCFREVSEVFTSGDGSELSNFYSPDIIEEDGTALIVQDAEFQWEVFEGQDQDEENSNSDSDKDSKKISSRLQESIDERPKEELRKGIKKNPKRNLNSWNHLYQ